MIIILCLIWLVATYLVCKKHYAMGYDKGKREGGDGKKVVFVETKNTPRMKPKQYKGDKSHPELHEANTKILKESNIPFNIIADECYQFRIIGKPIVDFFPYTGRWKLVSEPLDENMKGGAEEFLKWFNSVNNEKQRMGQYFRDGIFKPEDVFPFLVANRTEENAVKTFNNHPVNMYSVRLKTFKIKGISCVTCGITGQYLALEKIKGDNSAKWHFNLYAVNEKTKQEILMTVDHILPASLDGKRNIKNLQPMCYKCNHDKGNIYHNNELQELQTEIL